jgi:hypothetical protein
MHFVGERPAAALETLQQDQLSERPGAVERIREELGRPLAQLPVGARRGQGGAADDGRSRSADRAPSVARRSVRRVRRTDAANSGVGRRYASRAMPRDPRGWAARPETARTPSCRRCSSGARIDLLGLEEGGVERGEGSAHVGNLGDPALRSDGSLPRMCSVVSREGASAAECLREIEVVVRVHLAADRQQSLIVRAVIRALPMREVRIGVVEIRTAGDVRPQPGVGGVQP